MFVSVSLQDKPVIRVLTNLSHSDSVFLFFFFLFLNQSGGPSEKIVPNFIEFRLLLSNVTLIKSSRGDSFSYWSLTVGGDCYFGFSPLKHMTIPLFPDDLHQQ